MVPVKMFSVFISVLCLAIISSIVTEARVVVQEPPESFDRAVSEFSSIFAPLVSSSLKSFQSSDDLNKFLETVLSENGMDGLLLDYGIKSGVKNFLSNEQILSEDTASKSEPMIQFLKTMIDAAERLLSEHNVPNSINNNIKILSATFNSLPKENKDTLNEALSDVLTKLLPSRGIFEQEQYPYSMNYFLDGMRSLVGNRDLYEIIQYPLFSKKKSETDNDLEDLEVLNSNQINSIEVPDKETFTNEDSKSILETPSELKRKKRSTTSGKSLYSVLSEAMSSSAALTKSLKVLTSPEAKMNLGDLFGTVESFLGDGNSAIYLNELTEAIDSTFSRLTPDELTEAFANAMQKLLETTGRLMGDNYEEVFNRYVNDLKDAAEALYSEDDPSKHMSVLGVTIFSFLMGEEIAELQNFRTLMQYLISDMYSFSGMNRPSTNVLKSPKFEQERQENSIIVD